MNIIEREYAMISNEASNKRKLDYYHKFNLITSGIGEQQSPKAIVIRKNLDKRKKICFR